MCPCFSVSNHSILIFKIRMATKNFSHSAAFFEAITLNPNSCSQCLAVSTEIFLGKPDSKVSFTKSSLFTHLQQEHVVRFGFYSSIFSYILAGLFV